MITNVYYRPQMYTGGYNPVVWSFLSDKYLKTDFVYVIDIYINQSSAYTYRLKQRPNPIGVGMVDLSSVLQPFNNLTNYSVEEGWPLQFRNADEILASVFIMVGEEYIDDPTVSTALVIYDGNGNIGEPDYFIASSLNVGSSASAPVKILPAALPFNESQFNLASTADYGFWADYIMDGNGKFLKRDSNQIQVQMTDRHTLAFINHWYQPTSLSAPSQVQLLKVDWLSATGGTGTILYQNTTTNGGGPAPTPNYTTVTESRQTDLITFRCGPKDIWPTGPDIASYDVTAFYKATATSATGPQAVASETVQFTVVNYCQDLYPTVRLSWLNDLGGRDYYNFTQFYNKSTTSTEDKYNQTQLRWGSTTPVALDTDTNTTTNWLRGGDKSFNKTVTSKITISSDWLLQDEIDFLGAIPESPSVWAYVGTDPIPYTVIVDSLDYSYQTIKQVKVAIATFDMTITKTQQKQNL